MAFYRTFTTTRVNEPDYTSLLNLLRSIEPTIGIQRFPGDIDYRLKKNTDWTPAEISAAQNAIDAAPNKSPQLTAQAEIDRMEIALKALVLVLIDEINILRNFHGLAPRTPAQAIQAIRNKAGTL